MVWCGVCVMFVCCVVCVCVRASGRVLCAVGVVKTMEKLFTHNFYATRDFKYTLSTKHNFIYHIKKYKIGNFHKA